MQCKARACIQMLWKKNEKKEKLGGPFCNCGWNIGSAGNKRRTLESLRRSRHSLSLVLPQYQYHRRTAMAAEEVEAAAIDGSGEEAKRKSGKQRGSGAKGRRRNGDRAFRPPAMRPEEEGRGVATRPGALRERKPPPNAFNAPDDDEVGNLSLSPPLSCHMCWSNSLFLLLIKQPLQTQCVQSINIHFVLSVQFPLEYLPFHSSNRVSSVSNLNLIKKILVLV